MTPIFGKIQGALRLVVCAMCLLQGPSVVSAFGALAFRSVSPSLTVNNKHAHATFISNHRTGLPKLWMSDAGNAGGRTNNPTDFREAEILGLKAMQVSDYQGALDWFDKALKLPGTKRDIVRKQTLLGPSPVGGAAGGRTSQYSLTLDEFEYQAAHYNMACACCCLGRRDDAMVNLEKSFKYGFDNYKAVEMDPDLSDLQSLPEFETLMNQYDPKQKRKRKKSGNKGPFDFFG